MHSSSSQSSIYFRSLAFICVIFISVLDVVNGISQKPVIDAPLLTQKLATNRTIKVDINGQGDFKSVQAAIDSVPQGNSNWVIIHIRKGLYREKVHIPQNKPYIFMRGNGKGRTAIVWSQSSNDATQSATFTVEAPHFIAFGISFKNEAPTGMANTAQNQSVAALVSGDMAAFYHCAFFSSHNTLFDHMGRHYYDTCYIQGAVDFIFGRGQSIFHSCEIFVVPERRIEIRGSVTAQSRNSASENSGFVFVNGKVFGVGEVYLGRAEGAYSRVVFANTYMSKTIAPQGWTKWNYTGTTEHLYQAEYKCHGPGSAANDRATWSKQLNDKEVAPFLSVDFVNGKQWLPAWL